MSGRPAGALMFGLLAAAIALLPPAVALWWWHGAADETRQLVLACTLYWTTALIVVLAACAGVVRWRARSTPVAQLARQLVPGALLAIVLAVAVTSLVPPFMRVQFDETSLMGCSQNMHDHRFAVMTTGAIPQDGQIARIENTVDKRPPLFAFLVSAVHDVRGYRIDNGFVVNGALLALALFVAFAATRRHLGPVAATAAPLLLLALPLTSIVATSAGFELLAATLLGVVLVTALDFVRRPDRPRLLALLATGVLYAQSRYESLPTLVVVLALVAWNVRGRFRPDRGSWLLAALCPVLLTPVIVLLDYSRDPRFYPEAAGEPLVSLQHAWHHLGPFLVETFAPALDNPFPGVLGIAAVAVWTVRAVRRDTKGTDAIVVLPVLAVTGSALAWFIGDAKEPIAVRLFLPFAWLCALSPLLVLQANGRRWPAVAMLAAAAVLAALRVNTVRTGAAAPRGERVEQVDAIDRVVARYTADASRTLWITTAAQRLIVTGHAALCPRSFAYHMQQAAGRPWLPGVRIFVLETPLDAAMAPGLGDPRDVLRGVRSEAVDRTTGDVVLTVHRVRP